MKILSFTTLYPNREQPRHGIFVENRLSELVKSGGVEIKVLAPVPWFPLKNRMFGIYGKYARIPSKEQRRDIEVFHPRYPVIPKIGMSVAPFLMALAMISQVKKIQQSGFDFDLIDAHFFYPDGVVAVWLGSILNKKVVVTARGNDLTLYPTYYVPARFIKWAIDRADAVITVCQSLADDAARLGGNQTVIEVMRNGVDLDMFRPGDRDEKRKKLGLDGFTLISVGHHIERKGHHIVIDALQYLPGVKLMIAGDGPMEKALRQQVKDLGFESRVIFLGALLHSELFEYYSAADSLVLASSREGWANVLLESMACGTPVVATAVSGTPEVVKTSAAGRLVKERSARGIADAVTCLMNDYPDRRETRSYAQQFSWNETTKKQQQLFRRLIKEPLRKS